MVFMHRSILGASAVAAALATPVHAYNEFATHSRLTEIATQKSAMYIDPTLMFRLGQPPAAKQLFTVRSQWGSYSYQLAQVIAEGAIQEDAGIRVRHHFFDPFNNRPLTILGELGERSSDWMVESSAISGQDRSLRDGREYLVRALTFNQGSPAESDTQRFNALVNLYMSLGSAMHHMQDMHQPQHVRNDQHLAFTRAGINFPINPSRYEAYTRDRALAIEGYAASGTAVFPGSSDFRVARDFWNNQSDSGAAQFTNRNFVSQGANFTIRGGVANVGTYPLPRPGAITEPTVQELHAQANIPLPPQIATLCGNPATNCRMTMYAAGPSIRASTLSIFDQDLRRNATVLTYPAGDLFPSYQTERLFALNRFNFDDAHRTLIGSAVGYSAGIVNHFFRGKLEVSAPRRGAYAVVDHSAGQGFGTVSATVKNATALEAMPVGELMAIARFHRNNCYQPDLSGEWTQAGTGPLVQPCADYRSEEEHIRVTSWQAASFGIDQEKELTFTFSDPIPLDATDLVLQVLYRGIVGSELEALAVGAVDLSEPTWITVMNGTDVFEIPDGGTNKYFYTQDIIAGIANPPYSVIDRNGNRTYDPPNDVEVRGGDIAYAISVDGKEVGDVSALGQGRFFRLAALVNPTGFNLELTASGNGFSGTSAYTFPAKTAQVDHDRNSFIVSPLDKLRNQLNQWDSVTFSHFYPTSSADLKIMPISKVTDATKLVSVTMTPPTP